MLFFIAFFLPIWAFASISEVEQVGSSAGIIEIVFLAIIAFVLFTLLGRGKEKKVSIPNKNIADYLLDEIPLERVNQFSQGGTRLMQPKQKKGEVLLTLVKFDEKLYPEKRKSIFQKLFAKKGKK